MAQQLKDNNVQLKADSYGPTCRTAQHGKVEAKRNRLSQPAEAGAARSAEDRAGENRYAYQYSEASKTQGKSTLIQSQEKGK